MFEKRTDLALEVHELRGKDSGITVKEQFIDGVKVTRAFIALGEGERLSGKPSGNYITLETGKVWQIDRDSFEKQALILSDEIFKLMPVGNGCVLVVGLGNSEITPDSLGPRTVKQLLVTRHIESIDMSLFNSAGFGSVAAISAGVLAQTGIESAEIIKSVCAAINPKCVIAIDSLASRRLNRLATTVQLSDGGISPGSGVSNKRAEISKKTLGVPVISVGVPTVVDAATLAYDLLEEHSGEDVDGFSEVMDKILEGNGKDMFVTPKDNDIIAKSVSKLLATAINIAVHRMSVDEINDYLS